MSQVKAGRLDRKNLVVDGRKVRRLQHVLRAASESEAVRVAVDRALKAEEAIAALERIRKRGTLGRTLAS